MTNEVKKEALKLVEMGSALESAQAIQYLNTLLYSQPWPKDVEDYIRLRIEETLSGPSLATTLYNRS